MSVRSRCPRSVATSQKRQHALRHLPGGKHFRLGQERSIIVVDQGLLFIVVDQFVQDVVLPGGYGVSSPRDIADGEYIVDADPIEA
jgi:hypothetical protein